MLKQILFKRTALGIYTSEITHTSTTNNGIIKMRYGLLDGTKTSHTIFGTPKQYDAIINRKRREGYKSNVDLGIVIMDNGGVNLYNVEEELNKLLPKYNTDLDNYSKPMKCQKFQPNKFTYPCYGQPKINGVRATIRWGMKADGLFSKEGTIIKSHEGVIYPIKHIEAMFDVIFRHCRADVIFDGEIYLKNEHVTSIAGAARNPNNPIHSRLQFQCFDLAIPDVDQKTRISYRDELFQPLYYPGHLIKQTHIAQAVANNHVVNVFTTIINSDEEASKLREECLEAGYEGCVIRNLEADYRFGSRPITMMKLKKFTYGTFRVVNMIPFGFENTDNDIGKGIKFLLKNDITPDTFECNATGTASEKEDAMNNKARYIGKEVTIKYYERTITNLPFHANVILNK